MRGALNALLLEEESPLISQASAKEKPFFFGQADRGLFGCFHEPTGVVDRDLGVVLCNPLGHEAIRAHRALRQLAIRLARAGFPVLRFDYAGTGDSVGDDSDANLPRWHSDLGVAIDRLKRESGVQRIGLTGLRLGASVAALYGARHRNVACLALWEPVVTGRAHLDEMADSHRAALYRYAAQPGASAVSPNELLGFLLTPDFRSQIEALDLRSLTAAPAQHILIVTRQPDSEAESLAATLGRHHAKTQAQVIEGPVIWNEDVDKALVPSVTLDAIVSWFTMVAA